MSDLIPDLSPLLTELGGSERLVVYASGRRLIAIFNERVPRVLPFGPPLELELRREALQAPDVVAALQQLRTVPQLARYPWVAYVRSQCGVLEGVQHCEEIASGADVPWRDEIMAVLCCQELGRLGSSEAIEALRRLLTSTSWFGVRMSAAMCLTIYGIDDGKPLLQAAFQQNKSGVERLALAMALTRLADPSAARFVLDQIRGGESSKLMDGLAAAYLRGHFGRLDIPAEEIEEWCQRCVQQSG